MAKAAESLVGCVLPGGWTVLKRIERPPHASGSVHSFGYLARSADGIDGFLKAFDFETLFEGSGDLLREVQRALEIYNYERDVLEKCRDRGLSHVAIALQQGAIEVPGFDGPLRHVYYLIFEQAAGDARDEAARNSVDCVWFLRLLHHVAIGLRQLHRSDIAHQDVKPSNVLIFGSSHAKLGDLGRAADRSRPSPFDHDQVAGDPTYAPPESLYGHVDADWRRRRLGCDMYLLGSLLFFLVCRASLTEAILSRIYAGHHHIVHTGTFRDVLPHLQQAFSTVAAEFEEALRSSSLADAMLRNRLTRILRELGEPDPDRRGHPGNRFFGNPYDLERYVAEFDLIARRADIAARAIAKR